MNLYLISQNENEYYDTYDSAVVAAENEEEARNIHPGTEKNLRTNERCWELSRRYKGDCWVSSPKKVTAVLIDIAVEGTTSGVICASFNAG